MTASFLAGSIETQARAIADGLSAYAGLASTERDDLVVSIDFLIERLHDDWNKFYLKHQAERTKTP